MSRGRRSRLGRGGARDGSDVDMDDDQDRRGAEYQLEKEGQEDGSSRSYRGNLLVNFKL